MSKIISPYQDSRWGCIVAPSLGALEQDPYSIWGTDGNYDSSRDSFRPFVWFGLYGFPDFFYLWRHPGRKAILWAGSDIRHFVNGYWLEDGGLIRLDPEPLAQWINKNCESYVENHIEYEALKEFGIESTIVPSFLGDTKRYQIEYQHSPRPALYTSVSGNNFQLYGWDKVLDLARKNQDIDFHLYGNTVDFPNDLSNVFIHGRISKEQMNAEISSMQGALRMTEFDGFSEIIAKSLLWGQWPVSLIEYPHTLDPNNLSKIKEKYTPNIKGRQWLLVNVNKYPWNENN